MFSLQSSLLAIMASSLALSALAQQSSSSSSSSSTSSADVATTTTTTSAPSFNNAETSITALFGSATTGFVGSVVSANPCKTTLALVCDSENPSPVDVCMLVPDITATIILGPSAYAFNYATSTAGGLITIGETCDLDGPSRSFTAATCTASVYASMAGDSTSSATVATITDAAEFFSYAIVPITAGASSLLTTAGATCDAAAATQTEKGGAGADAERTSVAGAGPTARVGEVLYKIFVPVGAAVVAAGAGGLV